VRNLTSDALTKLSVRYGNEPIMIIEVAWNDDGIIPYAEREVLGIKGRILDISNLDNVITVSKGNDSQEITITLDDTDGTIKAIMNTYDIHKRDAWVYQWFDGLDLADRFLLFRGKISTPIVWKEGDRTITFTLISQLEDKEIGFSPEEGQFPYIPSELIGRTWPSIFGTPLDVPAVRIGAAVTGTTLCGVGVVSGEAYHDAEELGGNPPATYEQAARANYLGMVSQIYRCAGSRYTAFRYPNGHTKLYLNEDYDDRADEYLDQANEIRANIAKVWAQYSRAQECARCRRTEIKEDATSQGVGCNPLTILGGEDFPRGEITLAINGARLTGSFIGETNEFNITSRSHPENDQRVIDNKTNDDKICPDCETKSPEAKIVIWETSVPAGYGNALSSSDPEEIASGRPGAGCYQDHNNLQYDTYREKHIFVPSSRPQKDRGRRDERMIQFWADAGAAVKLATDPPFSHVVSIVPGTVLQVKAYKDFNGVKTLVDVPNDLWEASTETYGSITAEIVTVSQLTAIEGQEWESDDVYVTFESSIGPNIVDILTYLIQTYSDLQIDATSFAAVKTSLDPFPANFALLDRKNLVEALQEIAFQARCSLRLSNGIFYLKYLAVEPTSVDTITEKDIEYNSIEVTLTPTEDLVTKYTAEWRLSYAQDELNKIILRHNVKKYGIQEDDYLFYIYNQPDIVHKIATFWLIRKSNSWKHLKFKTFLHKLNLETFDTVLLQFAQDYVSSSNVKATIVQADFNSNEQLVNIECWVPVKSGEMDTYEFAWPANVSADWVFPTSREVDLGYDGGDGIGRNATGNLPVGDTSRVKDQAIFVGGPNVVFAGQTDRGDSHPSDSGFVAQSIGPFNIYANITVQAKPNLNLKLNWAEDIDAGILDSILGGVPEIVLERTRVKSVLVPDQWNTLAEIFVMETGKPLAIKTAALFAGKDDSGTCQKSPFHFKYNSEFSVWSAGSAYLAEEEAPAISASQNGELLGECDGDEQPSV
jgi:hypothetical protein